MRMLIFMVLAITLHSPLTKHLPLEGKKAKVLSISYETIIVVDGELPLAGSAIPLL